jgi:hypothetical protein
LVGLAGFATMGSGAMSFAAETANDISADCGMSLTVSARWMLNDRQ